MQQLNVGNGQVILFYNLLCMWLSIHAGIIESCYRKKGPIIKLKYDINPWPAEMF